MNRGFNLSKGPVKDDHLRYTRHPSSGGRCFSPGFEARSSTGPSEGLAQAAEGTIKRKSPEMGCPSFLLSILDENSEIFYS